MMNTTLQLTDYANTLWALFTVFVLSEFEPQQLLSQGNVTGTCTYASASGIDQSSNGPGLVDVLSEVTPKVLSVLESFLVVISDVVNFVITVIYHIVGYVMMIVNWLS